VDRALAKQRAKQFVRRAIGEPYVGKRLKLRSVNRTLDRLSLQPATVLDAGTEDATFVYWLTDRYPTATVTAVDIDTDAIAACLAARPTSYASRVLFDTTTFAQLPPDSFDLITTFDVLEHIQDDHAAVASLARALRPGGTLLVHVPRDRWTTWSGTVQRVPGEEAWRINPGHVRMGYSPESMRDLLAGAGLDVEQTETWLGRWGVLAHAVYTRLEHPTVLRLLSIPVTDMCAFLDARHPRPAGNTVFARAVKPG
jgi:SAM-dependent methyltransferase